LAPLLHRLLWIAHGWCAMHTHAENPPAHLLSERNVGCNSKQTHACVRVAAGRVM
jgi:hypothetical protein